MQYPVKEDPGSTEGSHCLGEHRDEGRRDALNL